MDDDWMALPGVDRWGSWYNKSGEKAGILKLKKMIQI